MRVRSVHDRIRFLATVLLFEPFRVIIGRPMSGHNAIGVKLFHMLHRVFEKPLIKLGHNKPTGYAHAENIHRGNRHIPVKIEPVVHLYFFAKPFFVLLHRFTSRFLKEIGTNHFEIFAVFFFESVRNGPFRHYMPESRLYKRKDNSGLLYAHNHSASVFELF